MPKKRRDLRAQLIEARQTLHSTHLQIIELEAQLAKENGAAQAAIPTSAEQVVPSGIPEQFQNSHTDFMLKLVEATQDSQDFDHAIATLLQLICQYTGWAYGEVWVPNADQSLFVCGTAHYIAPSSAEVLTTMRAASSVVTFRPKEGLIGSVWASGQAGWLPDVWKLTETEFVRLALCKAADLHGVVGIPIRGREQVIAVLCFMTHATLEQETQLVHLIEVATARVGSIIQRQKDTRELARYAKRMALLHEIDRGLIEGRSVQSLVETTLKRLRELIPCQRAILGVIDAETTEGTIFAVDLTGETLLVKGMRVPVVPFALEGLDERHMRVVEDMRLVADKLPLTPQLIQEGIVSGLQALLMNQDTPIGSLGLLATTPGFFSREYQDIAFEVANQLAIAINQLRLSGQLSQRVLELQQAHDIRRKNETRYRQVVDDQTEMICRYDADFRLTFVNRAYGEFYGKRADDLLGTNLLDLIPAEDRQAAKANVLALTADSPIATSEHQSILPDQSRRWFQWTDRALLDDNGHIVEYQGVGRDITDRKQRLIEQQQHMNAVESMQIFLRSTLDAFPASTLVLASDGTIININAPWRRFADENDSQSANYYLGDNYLDVCDRVTGKEVEDATATSAGIRAVIAGQQDEFHLEYPCPSETEQRWFRLTVTPFDEAPPRHVVVAHIDITMRKQAEFAIQEAHDTLDQRVKERTAELQLEKGRSEAILDNSFEGILLVQRDLRIERTNHAFNRLFLYDGEIDPRRTLLDLIDRDDADRVRVMMKAVINEQVNKQFEARARRNDGSTFEAEISIGHIDDNSIVCTIRDVTERKHAQDALAEERNLLRTLIDAAPDFIYMKDMQHRFVLSNKAHTQARGKTTPDEMVGKTDFDFFPPEVAAQFHADEDDILLNDKPLIDHEQPSKGFAGGFAWASSNKVPMHNLKGEIIGLVGITRDITERKAQERQLRYHASLQENVSDAVIATDLEYRIQSWNLAAERIYGWTAEEVIGKPVAAILRTRFDSDEEHTRIRKIFTETNHWSGEFTQYRKDGSEIEILGSTTLFKDGSGMPFGVISVNHDITESKQHERQLRYYASLLRNVNDSIISTDLNFNIQSWNRGAEVVFGWRADEVMGKSTIDIFQPRIVNGQTLDEFKEQLFAQQHWRGEVIHRRKDGGDVPVLLSFNLVKDERDQLMSIVGVGVDITERKQTETALQAKMEEEREFQTNLKNLHEITIELTSIEDIDAIYRRAVVLGRERLGFERLALFLYDEAQQVAIGTYGTNLEGQLTDEHAFQFTPAPNKIELRSLKLVERFAIDYEAHLSTRLVPAGIGWNAAAVLWNGSKGLGWLMADNAISHAPATKAMLDILSLYALALGAILAQKKVQSTLRESELRYRLLADNATDVVMRLTARADYTYVSPSSEAVVGYIPEALVGQNAINYAHPDDLPTIQNALQNAIASGATVRLESRYRHQQGHYVWLESLVRPIFSETTGEVEEYISSSRDITERKQAEAALRESEEKFRRLVQAAPISIVITDERSVITLVNEQAEQVFGYRQAELIGKPVETLVPDQFRKKHVRNRTGYVDNPQIRRMGAGVNMTAKRKDGSEFPVEIELSFIKTNTDFMVMSFIADITERQQTAAERERQQAFLRQVIDGSPSMIFVKDYDSKFILVNPMLAKMYNATVEEMIGQRDTDLNPSTDEVKQFQVDDRRVIDTGEPMHIEEPFTDLTGAAHWVQTTKVPIDSLDGKSRWVLGIATDITERRQMEDALRQTLQKEKELGDLKTRFVSMASHEFRTPLATILALTETVITYRERLTDDQVQQRLLKIQNQVWHLRDIIEDVLQLARIQARRVEFNPVTLDLDSLCRSVVDEFDSRPDFTHKIVYRCDTELKEVKLDRRLMRQVISNLVSNAIKYSESGTTVMLDLGMQGDKAVLRITDEGIGIPEPDLKYLYEAFHRAANVGTIPGTGLGLVITKESIELHGGTISVESKVNVGTTFTVSIPIAQ